MSIDTSKLDDLRATIARKCESRADREQREAQQWMDRHEDSVTAPVVTVDRPDTYRTLDTGTQVTEREAVEYRNLGAYAGALGEVDYAAQEDLSYWEAMVLANPDGNTTGEHVPGTVDGTGTTATDRYAVDRAQADRQRSPHLEVPTFAWSTSGARFIDHRPRAHVERRPQGAVTVVATDRTWTVLPGGTHKGFDGTGTTQRRVVGSIAAAERVARNDASCDACLGASNGECAPCEKRRAARERKRRQRERERTPEQRDAIAQARDRAMAVAAAGWDTDTHEHA